MNLPEKEKEILSFWEKEGIFEKSVEQRKGKKPFVFYEGPPTANGRPGIHHVLARSFKDIILRYKAMQGFYVERKAGWDTHGLPVELEIEKELGIKTKQGIEEYGIEKFINKAKESVWRYKKEWEQLTKRMGFWIDMRRPYITYETEYIESLWFIIKAFYEKKLFQEDFKVVPWCTRCGTPLSSHELAQGYKKTTDTSIYVKFKIENPIPYSLPPHTYILSWTTTPWTLPGNVALAVGKDITYAIAKDKKHGEVYILAKERLGVLENEYDILDEVKGKNLVGLSYKPLFNVPELKSKKSHQIYEADFVNTQEGTGVVHTSVMYGEDDYQLGKRVGLPMFHTVTEEGHFLESLPYEFKGMYVKSKKAEESIEQALREEGFFFKKEEYTHDYPFCWRCKSPLLYYATKSWFVRVSKARKQLIKNNDTITWIPEHLQKGRFGNFLEEAKDWAFSRKRYWGTPLPIWQCASCEKREVIGSLEELAKKAKPRNTFLIMRHAGAQNNVKQVLSSLPEKPLHHLTQEGKCQADIIGKKLKKEKIDIIVTSPLTRTHQTAEIISKATGASVAVDMRLREVDTGDMNGKSVKEYQAFWGNQETRFTKKAPDGMENFAQVKTRMMSCIQELNEKYRGKTILLVSHGGALWALEGALKGLSNENIAKSPEDIKTSEVRKVSLNLPFNEKGEVDVHRPFIDEIVLRCSCKKDMKRISDVADVWFDSGAMPFAQAHWPFADKINNSRKLQKLAFPADYICEAIDQTRGWFYTLLVVSTLLGLKAPYKHVISLGHLLDDKGRKMSKSLGNIVNPFEAMDNLSADAIRWYFFVVNTPGSYKRFDIKEIRAHHQRFLLTLFNVLNFWKMHTKKTEIPPSLKLRRAGKNQKSKTKYVNVLDTWITSRLHEVTRDVTANLDAYNVTQAARALEQFVDDLSNWYVRRSRDRFGGSEREHVSNILEGLLVTVSKLIAPFTPFSAEALYQEVSFSKDSVHLHDFPKAKQTLINVSLNNSMQELRHASTLALAARAQAGIKVRQPIAELRIKNFELRIKNEELISLIKDEVNVKKVLFDETIPEDIKLDTNLTDELREEGFVRDLTRSIQDLRKQAGLTPQDKIILYLDPQLKTIGEKWNTYIIEKTNAISTSYTLHPTPYVKQLNFKGKTITIGVNVKVLPHS